MNEQKRKLITWATVLTPIVLIGTCNVYFNTKQETELLKNPQAGDYYVFTEGDKTGNLPFKIKEVTKDSIYFYMPQYAIMSLKQSKIESAVHKQEAKNDFYSDVVIGLDKATISKMTENPKHAIVINEDLSLAFVTAFGTHRTNAVDKALHTFAAAEKEKINMLL